MKWLAFVLVIAVLWTVGASGSGSRAAERDPDVTALNSTVRADDGRAYGTLRSVNGDVQVGRGAIVAEAKSVNGHITLEEDARVGEVRAVNGTVRIGSGVVVDREVLSVNGNVAMAPRSRAGGDVATVSGDFNLVGAEVGGDLRTVHGDIELREGSRVRGDILVKKSRGAGTSGESRNPVRVQVCATCVVDGELRFERPVELQVEPGARIGKVIGEEVTRR